MAQLQKLSTQVDIKSNADVFYKSMKNNFHNIPRLVPHFVKDVKMMDNNLVFFQYVINGNTMTLTEKVELNDSDKSLNTKVVEGDVLKTYTSLKFKSQVYNGYVELTAEFEKAKDDSPVPDAYLNIIGSALKKFDAVA